MKILALLPAVILASCFTGCVVAPAGRGYVAPPGVAYVEPGYASPGAGYRWEYHPQYGWGWHDAQYGWHKGWQ